jgi:hypothetical protein
MLALGCDVVPFVWPSCGNLDVRGATQRLPLRLGLPIAVSLEQRLQAVHHRMADKTHPRTVNRCPSATRVTCAPVVGIDAAGERGRRVITACDGAVD